MSRSNKLADLVNTKIGALIQELRLATGLSRGELSKRIGVTHQQLEKYEKGKNRISAGRLHLIAKVFEKPVAYFFDNIESSNKVTETIHTRLAIELSRNFFKVENLKTQVAINDLVRSLSANN